MPVPKGVFMSFDFFNVTTYKHYIFDKTFLFPTLVHVKVNILWRES